MFRSDRAASGAMEARQFARTPATQRDDLHRAIEAGWIDGCGSSRRLAGHRASESANARLAKPARRAESGANAEGHAQVRASARDVSGLLIRGFGVQVPGGAPVSGSSSGRADFARFAALASLAPSKSGSTALAAQVIGHLPDSILRVCSRGQDLRRRDGECSLPLATSNLRDLGPPHLQRPV